MNSKYRKLKKLTMARVKRRRPKQKRKEIILLRKLRMLSCCLTKQTMLMKEVDYILNIFIILFFKLTQNIIHTFKFYHTEVEDLEHLQHEIEVFLIRKTSSISP